jgi:hypothetical protein
LTVHPLPFSFSLSGESSFAIVKRLLELGWLPREVPARLSIDSERVSEIAEDWLEKSWAKKRCDIIASWEEGEILFVSGSDLVKGERLMEFSPESVLAALVHIPFQLAAFGPMFDEWEVPSASFRGGHVQFGWAVAFREGGYRHIPGRRWLERGPFRLLKHRDFTLVLFHDPTASAADAAIEAEPGHEYIDSGYEPRPLVRDDALEPDAALLATLGEALSRERPDIVARLPAARFSESTQDFFPNQRIVRLDALVTLYLVLPSDGPAQAQVLSRNPDVLSRLARLAPPTGLDEPDRAERYADTANLWTRDSVYGELELREFDDLPFYERTTPELRARIASARSAFGERILERTSKLASDGWHFRYWLVDACRLIERELIVAPTGELQRIDVVHIEDLPVFRGKVWGIRNGRLRPIG